MKASVNWLRSLVPGLEADAAQIAERLTRAGLEVESVAHFGPGLDKVIVAEVRLLEPHPSRSGLRLVTVDRGSGELKRVVCGAANVPDPGGLVCLAEVGTYLPAKGLTLDSRAIGGVVSDGMLCSVSELGLGDGGDGILILPPGLAAPGTPLSIALPAATDTILEIGVTPNRPDALGHIGIARDVAVLFGLPFHAPEPAAPARVLDLQIESVVRIEVQDFERCPYYGGLVVNEVVVGPSPLWLQLRLTSLGVRPVSNLVDITNLILLEYGHPMHAFDLDLIRGARIVVRRANEGEVMITLDGVEHRLDPDDLLICDAEGPIALAGVMGGQNTEIRETTRRVLFECAFFNPRGIRRTARRHGMHTESSHRFERGVDAADAPEVLNHAGSLATRLAQGAAVRGSIQVQKDPWIAPQVVLRHGRLQALLGVEIAFEEAKEILNRLGFETKDLLDPSGRAAEVSVPSHRPDVSREADLIEEIARIRGLDSIPTVIPPMHPQAPRNSMFFETRARAAAVELGLSEALTYSFVSESQLKALDAPVPTIRLLNPLSEDRNVMRTSLLPGLLEAVSRAARRGERNARLFTIGAKFLPGKAGERLPEERLSFAAVLAGVRDSHLHRPESIDVFDAKGIAIEMISRVTQRDNAQVELFSDVPKHLHPRGAGRVLVDGLEVAVFGLIHPDVRDAYEIEKDSVSIEVDLVAIEQLGVRSPRFRAIPRLPAVTRDISLEVHDDISAGEVSKLIEQTAGELCESVELFDVFRGGKIPAEHRALAFHVVYRDPKAATDPEKARTLTAEDVDKRHEKVVRIANERLAAKQR